MSTSAGPAIFIVAGHDPTGGAGIDADREAALHFGVGFGFAVTAWTEQDGRSVQGLGARPAWEWASEVRERAGAEHVVWKSGLLPGAEHVRALAALVREARAAHGGPRELVVDPVLAASGGEPFLDGPGIEALLEELVPLGVLLTPNLPEAARLTGLSQEELASRPESRVEAARLLLARGARGVLVKAGHGREDPMRELLAEPGQEPLWLPRERIPGAGMHGSGCRHASAVAAQLALGVGLADAARGASHWLAELLAR